MEKLSIMISKISFHTFLFSLLPILFLYSFNIHEILPDKIIIPLLGSLAIVFVIWLVLRFFIGSEKSGLMISWFLVLFALHGNIHILLLNHDNEFLQIFGKNLILGPIFFTIFVLGIIYLHKTKSLSDKISVANVMSITIVGFLSISIIVFFVGNPVDLTASKYVELPLIVADLEKKPDVYFFVLDGYSGRDTLKSDFNYDLTNFENKLMQRGFLIPQASYSNYPSTAASSPSFLNMMYLDVIPNELGKNSTDQRIIHKITNENNVMKIFKKNGYRITTFYAGSGATGDPTLVDRKLCNYGTIDYDLRKNFVLTYIPISYFNKQLLQQQKYEKLECFFSTVMNFDKDEQRPDYIHGHISLPHAPYIYNEKGERVFSVVGLKDNNAYFKQLLFTNTKMLEIIDSIQNHSPTAIIMIIADHGYRGEINWENPTNKDYTRGFNIISAFYFPGKDVNLPSEFSTVNTFRIFFNEYFNANYEILENRHFWHVEKIAYFDYREVSNDFKN